jgi:sodium-dependent dicarboxylate transporter 2/3/5
MDQGIRVRERITRWGGTRERVGLPLGLLLFFACLVLPTPEGMPPEAKKALATALLMATWWITEAIPIPATALIPLVAYPLMGVMSSQETATPYANHNVFLFMGGFFIAMAMQKWGLHRRIALHTIRLVGTSPRRLVLGFMVATAFLSMWISNTATTMMMLPIAMAVVGHLGTPHGDSEGGGGADPRLVFGGALMLGIAYAASLGGMATLIGTPPNLVFAGVVKELYPDAPEIGFFQWMAVGVPLLIVFLPAAWYYLNFVAYRQRVLPSEMGRAVIAEELSKLGRMSRGERVTLTVFVLTALGWMFRREIPIGSFAIPGWADLLGIGEYVHDSTVAMIGALLLFLWPVDLRRRSFALDWEWARRIPWSILILFGGGFALAASFQKTGLASWIGGSLTALVGVPVIVMIVLICLLLTFLTEMTSNTATSTMMLPILAGAAMAMRAHPFLLMVPATLSASCAFMLPVATPPNAIVFGSGYLTIPKMARVGLAMNLMGVVIITAIVYLVGVRVLGITLGAPPVWAQ